MNELELRLQELGGQIAYPATPRFDLGFDRRPSRVFLLRPLAIGFAVLLATLGAVLALSPGARSAFLEIFRLQGASVELVETLPPVEVQTAYFGERVGREEAERLVGFRLLDLGKEPDGIYVRSGTIASLVYGDPRKPRLVLTQLRGAVYEGFVKKVGTGGTSVVEVRVNGERGLFVSGDEHYVMFLDDRFDVSAEVTFLAGTVLLWNRGELLLRLEGELTRAEALALARSVE
ncbi:MAG: hypothetical protein M3R12_00560 [Actinomycetota bacterium]|nr:hypothetical protein [Actinomycetota bacterium]